MANITATLKLNDHNFREWDIYFRGKLMMKGMHQLLTQMPTSTALDASSEDQKAFGILIDTLEPRQYRYIDGHTRVRVAYDALVAQHKQTTKIDRIQVAMEWAKLSWDPRQETLPDFIYRFQILVQRLSDVRAAETESNQVVKLLALMLWEFRHLADRLSNLPDSEQTVAKTKIALEAEWKAATAPCSNATPKETVVVGVAGAVARPEAAKLNETTSECRKKSRENGRPNLKGHWPDGKDDHSNAAVFMFSATESGIDMIALSQ
ncbi:hypothetical protein H310_13739 [Aphanomyces invadans]|uniref:Uncharacterized protein n=1 Tax=Aphanomyces invadans TaxID=157072 RepID=A0A024TDJ2_9STRA|nr:hypothetical protein H310_13739 [Aphanomyces invadans]ETV91661.1 hypothetical protein H310_13739 [Aphanomyces invadans]|eukprot:XP_008879587.1 hypothetical protein H310_13739 [Aphanomyces invadans]